MKKTRRTSKVGENVRDALVEVFRHDLRDIKLGFTSVTAVEVSPDLHYAKVHITGLKEKETRDIVDQLQEARAQVRHHLAKRVKMRYTPELDFRFDDAPERGGRIEDLLTVINKKQAKIDAQRAAEEAQQNDDNQNENGNDAKP